MRVLTQSQNQLKLDANDWKILAEIRNNFRQPLTSIAEKCLLSRQAVEYRLKQMAEKQLITGSRTIVNTRKLGYKSYHVFIEAHTPHEEKELLQRAKDADYVNAIILYSGKYNIEISIMARGEEEFLGYYAKLVEKIKIRDDQVLVLLETIAAKVLPDKYLRKKEKEKNYSLSTAFKNKEHAPDLLDLRLLYSLSREATKTNQSLAKEFNLSKDTVKYRIRQLEESRMIFQYRPAINYSALGLSINSVLIKLNYKDLETKQFEALLRSNDSVLWCAKTFGYYDYLIYVITRNLDEFHETINAIKQQFSELIKTYEVLFAYEERKYDFMARSILEDFSREK